VGHWQGISHFWRRLLLIELNGKRIDGIDTPKSIAPHGEYCKNKSIINMNILKSVLYAAAVIIGLFGFVILIGALSFQTGLSNALLPLRMAGMGPMLDMVVPMIAQGVAFIGVLLFFALLATTLLLVVAARLIGRSITLEDRIRRLEAQFARLNPVN